MGIGYYDSVALEKEKGGGEKYTFFSTHKKTRPIALRSLIHTKIILTCFYQGNELEVERLIQLFCFF